MTFLEKAMEIENETEKGLKREEVIQRYCPSSYDLEAGNGCSMSALEKCRICWNREMPNTELVKTVTLPMPPNTEPKEDKPFTEKEVYEEAGYNKGLIDGRNETWEFVRIIYDMKCDEIEKIFGVSGGFWEVIRDYSQEEALAKLKAYEEAQSKVVVGDVVNHREYGNGIVTIEDGDFYHVVCANGEVVCFEKNRVTKTGKHLDIKSILESIGE